MNETYCGVKPRGNTIRLCSFVLLTMSASFLPLSVSAIAKKGMDFQTQTAIERQIVDGNGIEVMSGRFSINKPLLTIGDPKNGGLQWSYTMHTGDAEIIDQYSGKVRLEYGVYGAGTKTKVTAGNSADSFRNTAGETPGLCTLGCINILGRSSSLVRVGDTYIYVNSSGDIYNFDALAGTVNPPYSGTIARLSTIQYANGVTISIAYEDSSSCAPKTVGCVYRIKNVVSNTGYALKYEYSGGFFQLSKVSAVNYIANPCDTTTLNCATFDSSVTVSYPSGLGTLIVQVVDGVGAQYRFGINDENYYDIAVSDYAQLPNGDTINVDYDVYGRATTYVSSLGTWTYSYSDTNQDLIDSVDGRVTTTKNPDFATRKYSFIKTSMLPTHEIDELARRTNYLTAQLSSGGLAISRITKPEGDYTAFGYDARGNVTSTTNTPKTGSGLASTMTSSAFGTNCTYSKTCNKPIWTKDAKSNQTDYVYDNNHGGVLTVTLPEDQNGLRTRTYNTYTPYDTGTGIIYRLTRTEACGLTVAQLTLTACPALSTTSVTVTNYGTSLTAPKTYKTSLPLTVTQTDGASSLAATTTYAYDNVGNVTSVDGPLVGTVDQSFITYDANRRKIFEIGPIPGGMGTQKRTLVRHAYDGAGHETQTALGYANTNATNGSDAVFTSYSRMTYDTAGRLIKTEAITKEVVVP